MELSMILDFNFFNNIKLHFYDHANIKDERSLKTILILYVYI